MAPGRLQCRSLLVPSPDDCLTKGNIHGPRSRNCSPAAAPAAACARREYANRHDTSFPNFFRQPPGHDARAWAFERMTKDHAGHRGEERAPWRSRCDGDGFHGGAKRAEARAHATITGSADLQQQGVSGNGLQVDPAQLLGDKVDSGSGQPTMLGVNSRCKLNVTSVKCGPHPFRPKPMCGAYVEGHDQAHRLRHEVRVPRFRNDVEARDRAWRPYPSTRSGLWRSSDSISWCSSAKWCAHISA